MVIPGIQIRFPQALMRKCAEHIIGCLEEGTGTPVEYGLAKARVGTSGTIGRRRLALLPQPPRDGRSPCSADPQFPPQGVPRQRLAAVSRLMRPVGCPSGR